MCFPNLSSLYKSLYGLVMILRLPVGEISVFFSIYYKPVDL